MRRIAVVGASGRTGSKVVSALVSDAQSDLCAAIVSLSSKVLGQKVIGSSVLYSSDLEILQACDGVIDFSTPEVSARVAEVCVKYRKPLLVATTGHTSEQQETLEASARSIPLCIAANTSVGAIALAMAARYLKKLLGETFDVEVMEMHHRMKRDAPSGTAKEVLKGLSESSDQIVFGREKERRSGEVGVVSVRGGDVPGDHTVFFLGEGERLEVIHRAQNREIFGRGAVVLMCRLCDRPPGFYSAQELLLSGAE